ncbi:MAG: hypothetical protein QOD07_2281 [Frankiaceae bacterium]|nr:hypothetical protein [Frankiaceae bacterium]
MGWTFVWLMVALKVPIAALLYIVHWAAKAPEDEEAPSGGDGGVKPPHRPRLPRHPRHRGPHGAPGAAPVPPRVRPPAAVVARAGARHHP